MYDRKKALLTIIICVVFWGVSFVSIKVAVTVFPPMTLGACRFALAIVFLTFIKSRLAPDEKLKVRDLPLLVGAGLTGVTAYFFCENNGVSLVSASEASIIVAAIPALTVIVEWTGGKFRRKTTREPAPSSPVQRWLGALISTAGVWLVAGVSFSVSGSIWGYVYMGGAALSWVAYSFLTRPLFARCSRIHIVFWQSVFGFIGFLPFAAQEFPSWSVPTLPVLGHTVFLGICCSALGYWFYAYSLEQLGVSVTSVFLNFIPVVTVAVGFAFLGEKLMPLQWLGALLVLSGVTLAMTGGKGGKTRINPSP
ncbi:MAG: DMT family transporter [Treponema sp.]|jgi:drug/metabolite transporter (DMT)-like permease|nr:DMT family transporter [Treponema sp.]